MVVKYQIEDDDTLRDGSVIEKVKDIWMTETTNYKNRFTLIEAETSFGQTVLCSTGPYDLNLGRNKLDDDDSIFEILDYEPDMTSFTKVVVDAGAAVAIDDEGEIWILAGMQNDFYNLNLQPVNKKNPRG